jgi:hypothetical protein
MRVCGDSLIGSQQRLMLPPWSGGFETYEGSATACTLLWRGKKELRLGGLNSSTYTLSLHEGLAIWIFLSSFWNGGEIVHLESRGICERSLFADSLLAWDND